MGRTWRSTFGSCTPGCTQGATGRGHLEGCLRVDPADLPSVPVPAPAAALAAVGASTKYATGLVVGAPQRYRLPRSAACRGDADRARRSSRSCSPGEASPRVSSRAGATRYGLRAHPGRGRLAAHQVWGRARRDGWADASSGVNGLTACAHAIRSPANPARSRRSRDGGGDAGCRLRDLSPTGRGRTRCHGRWRRRCAGQSASTPERGRRTGLR
jgi:hypothetical protein